MSWGCAILFAAVALLGRLIKRKWNNLMTVFAGFYAFTIALASLQLWQIKAASLQACLVLVTGILSYVAGYVVIIIYYQKPYMLERAEDSRIINEKTGYKYVVRKEIIYGILLVVVLFTLYSFFRAMLLIREGTTFTQLRSLYFNENETVGRNRFDLYIYLPLLQSLVLISCAALFSNVSGLKTKFKVWLVVCVIACEILSMFTNGGRENVVYAILTILFAYSISDIRLGCVDKWHKQIWKKRKKQFIILFCFAAITVIIMTMNRSKTGETSFDYLKRTIYFYSAGWLPHFSERLSLLDNKSFTQGYAFILGLIRLPAAVVHRLGVPDSQAYSLAEGITGSLQDKINIGGGRMFNAYVSLFYYFYRDFGYISLIVESFIFGGFCALREKKFEIDRNIKNMFWYLFAFFLVISSMVRWEMIHIKTAMIVYYSFVFFKKKKESDDIIC